MAGRHRHAILVCAGLMLSTGVAAQPEPTLKRLEGAWVPEGSRCRAVFFRQGTAINFARPGARAREGILVVGNRMRDPSNSCTIAKVSEAGEARTLLLACFSGLLVSKISFSIRFPDDDTVIRTLNDFPEEKATFRRCRL
jgi:hypothetical protein